MCHFPSVFQGKHKFLHYVGTLIHEHCVQLIDTSLFNIFSTPDILNNLQMLLGNLQAI